MSSQQPAAYKIKVAPLGLAEGHDLVLKGVVEEVGSGILDDPEDHERWGEALRRGNTVFYRDGITIDGSVFIETTDIIAFEEAPDADTQNRR